MTTFDEREKGFEAKYRQDQDLRFKVTARRNKLVGLWAAERMGMTGEAASAYAKEVVIADLDEPGEGDVVRKLLTDLQQKGVASDEAEIRRQLEKMGAVARDQIDDEAKAVRQD